MSAPRPLNSCLYEGEVRHSRLTPRQHEFRYRIELLMLDLDELNDVFRGRWLWSAHRPAIARFHRGDHFGDPTVDLKTTVADLVEQQLGWRPKGPIRLLTQPRYFGYVINPVSFYFCFDPSGSDVEAFVAEVTNTPWGETHCYVFDWTESTGRTQSFANTKDFHVSPFMPMALEYRWRVTSPEDRLAVRIENHEPGRHIFTAQLDLERQALTGRALSRHLIKHPFQTAKVFSAIYWQALRLWWKGILFHPHPESVAQQAGLSAPPTKTTP